MRFELLTSDSSGRGGPEAPASLAEILGAFCEPVRAWWNSHFVEMSRPQKLAIPIIHEGKHALVCAPTGTGKTQCAFISILNDLLVRSVQGTLDDAIDTVYISPLKALGSDIARNLLRPLREIAGAADSIPDHQLPIRVAMRSGDTTAWQRARMLRTPPHILITTPESLALCLANPPMRDHLRRTRRIIVDELHSLAPNKRGVDLMLSVERLADLVTRSGGADPQRIGLSATIAPLETMAAYLVGAPIAGRNCSIVNASFERPLDLQIASVFGKTPFATTEAINRHVYDLLEKTVRSHRTTLVFTNLRSATERVTYALRKRFAAALQTGEHDDMIHPFQIEAHHSSLDRDVRLDIERRLKAGELRCVVCSTSLELGIDIGSIDRVILLNSPKGVARGLQRVGRSGHSLSGTASGIFVPTTPADLIEAMVTADAMRKRQIDEIVVPRNCLDVLAQHLIGLAVESAPHGILVEDAFELVRRTWPYAELSRGQFDAVIRYIASEELTGSEFPVHAKLLLDSAGRLHPLRKSVATLYSQNVGTITQEGQVKVRLAPSNKQPGEKSGVIGTIEEAFAQMLKPGDRFLLGGRCVAMVASRGMSIEVVESAGLMPTIPRWFSGMMAMEPGLATRMRDFRAKVRAIAPAGESAIARMLTRQYSVPDQTALVAAAYLHAQFRYANIPIDGQLLVERVSDGDATVLVFHTMVGRAANDALARVIAYRMHRRFSSNPRAGEAVNRRGNATGATVGVDDYAFAIWVDKSSAARRADRTIIRSLLAPEGFCADLSAAVESSDLFRSQFRFTAIRAHALLQNKFGRRRFIGQMHSYAGRLYEALRESDPQHLLITETRRTVREDILAAPQAERFLQGLAGWSLQLMDLPSPSPFAFGLFATSRRDSLALADTADFLLAMYAKVQHRLAQCSEPPHQAELFS